MNPQEINNNSSNDGENKVARLIFPTGFFWGAATSAHQAEGGNVNDWSEWEKANAERLANEAGKKWKKWQQEKFPEMFETQNYISGAACDHYSRYAQDFDIAKELGHNAHRFSIEWSRVEPEEGKFSEGALEHYRQVILALRVRGLEPFVTLWHWTLPLWVRDIGGWENLQTSEYFLRFVSRLLRTPGIGDSVKYWSTINEPGVYIGFGYVMGIQPPAKKNIFKANRVFKNLLKTHRRAYQLIHSNVKDAQVVVSHSVNYRLPIKDNAINRLLIKVVNYFGGGRFFENIKDSFDIIGVQYYRPEYINFKLGGNRLGLYNSFESIGEASDLGWGILPEGIYQETKKLLKYNKPFIVTENGIADVSDVKRAKYIKDHLFWLHKLIEEGVDLRGYFYWSLIDNFEFVEGRGFWPRFGLVEIDYKTQERKIRPSAWEYKKIIENSLS